MKINSPVVSGILLMGLMLLFSLGCRKSDAHPDYPAGSNENINSWVLDSMKVYYYWNTSLPKRPDLGAAPADFFKGIKNGADRFSALVNPDLPDTYPPSLAHTLGFDMLTFQQDNGLVETMISLVVPGSSGEAGGLQRGDVVKTINGTAPTATNIASLTDKAISAQRADLEIEGRADKVSVSRLTTSEIPVYTSKVLTSGAVKYGYLFLNSFEEPAVGQLEEVFNAFKQQQVQELILDLRYNPGGSVPVAAALAAMVAPAAAENSTFVEYRGNANAGSRKSSFAAELSRLPQGIRKSFGQFTAYRLGISRVYILSGSHTASAAELVINGLKPYISVIQLGGQSLGKDMASFVIRDYRTPQVVQNWEIYPMVFKLYNAAGRGDYSAGLVPDQAVDELAVLPLKPFGDPGDPLIRQCTGVQQAGPLAAARDRAESGKPAKLLFDSRDREDFSHPGLSIRRN